MELVCLPVGLNVPVYIHTCKQKCCSFSTDLLIGEIYHTLCHINIIPCVTANFS